MRLKKKYSNGQKRGGEPSVRRSAIKDYHRMEIMFHGSESSFQRWKEKKKGY
jgi:hypothetical protein